MASVSASSSLGNTALRGFGGLVSGLDRDALIEQMTMGTQSKIDKIQSDMTKLEWKQEAYRNITDMILGMQDDYFSYGGSSTLTDGSFFGKTQITAVGKEEITDLIGVTGQSDMLEYLSILGVKQLASSAYWQSREVESGSITIDQSGFDNNSMVSSKLEGTQLRFATWREGTGDDPGKYENQVVFTLPSTYKDENGKTQEIDYTADPEVLAGQLQKALEQSELKMGDEKLSDLVEFKYQNGKLNLAKKDGAEFDVVIQEGSTALAGLGYEASEDGEREKNGISLDEYNQNLGNFSDSYLERYDNAFQYLSGKKLSVTLNGTTKEIELVTKEEYEQNPNMALEDMIGNVQSRLDKAFGQGKVTISQTGGGIELKTADDGSTLSISSSDGTLLKNLGLENGASNRLNLSGSLDQENLGLGDIGRFADAEGNLNLTINGVKVEGLTEDSTLGEIMDAINQTEGIGVKATYVEATGQFSLIATETGEGREIDLGAQDENNLAWKLFGEGGVSKDGQDAVIMVSYGNGTQVEMKRSSNTFDLEGLTVTVSGTFGYTEDGELEENRSNEVRFTGSADVDGVTEAVSKFFETYNKLVEAVNAQVTTKPDSSYGPLTDDQKAEMTDEEIERWEEKGKAGILFGDSVLRDLSADLQGILTTMAAESGVSLQELEEIGISVSDDYKSGGVIVFDEAKFRSAMESDPDRVGEIFAGGKDVSKGLAQTMQDTLKSYATKYSSQNGGSYGRLVEVAGSERVPLSVTDNQIYKELKDMQENIATLRERLLAEQDRYIRQFSTLETLISQMNSQSSWLSSMQ